MVLARWNSHSIDKMLYAGQKEKVWLYKRNDDQQESQVQVFTLFDCRRGNISKTRGMINLDTQGDTSTQWIIPCIMLRSVGVNYINVCDRILDQFGAWWQAENDQTITLSQFDQYYLIQTIRVDPPGNQILFGTPGVGLPVP